MKISIIVPIYNNEKYISRCIESIINQTYSDLELLLINDGSTDNTKQICEKYQSMDSRIKLFNIDNNGVSNARNTGLEKASGDIISFVDSDDWIENKLYEKATEMFNDNKIDVLVYVGNIVYDTGKISRYYELKSNEYIDNIDAINRMNYIKNFGAGVCLKMFRRDVINDIRFPLGVTIGEDYAFNSRVLMNCQSIGLMAYIGYNYFQRSDSVSYKGFQDAKICMKNIKNYDRIKNLFINYNENVVASSIAYYVLQMMAVVISMVKSEKYDMGIIKFVCKKVRKYLKLYVMDKNVPFYQKCCAILISINYRMLVVPYKIFFKKRREA